MKIKLEKTEYIAALAFEDKLSGSVTISVPSGCEALFTENGEITAVLGEGENKVAVSAKGNGLFSKSAVGIYLMNRTKQYSLLWGTGGIAFMNRLGEKSVAGASGNYEYALDNSAALMRKFGFPSKIENGDIRLAMKTRVSSAVKEAVLSAIESGAYNVGAKLTDLEKSIMNKLEKSFTEYGLFLDRFIVEEITDSVEN